MSSLTTHTNIKIGDNESQVDSVVTSVLEGFVRRAVLGKEKYGTDLDRTDLNVFEWLQHAQEEHMDAILYLEKLKNEMKKHVNAIEILEKFREKINGSKT